MLDVIRTARWERVRGARPVSCEVFLENLEIQADIGAHAHEFGRPQPLVIDVRVAIEAPVADDLSETLDYACIRRFATELATRRTVLIETFAHQLARACLAHPGAQEVTVRIAKPMAVPGCLAGVCVRLSRS